MSAIDNSEIRSVQPQPAVSDEFNKKLSQVLNQPYQSGKKTSGRQTNNLKVLHFSDGTLEEPLSSSDEDEDPNADSTRGDAAEVDPKTLTWPDWLQYQGSNTVKFIDHLGETLAYHLGITSRKYQYEIDEYYRMKEEEEAQDVEMTSWSSGPHLTDQVSSSYSVITNDITSRNSTLQSMTPTCSSKIEKL